MEASYVVIGDGEAGCLGVSAKAGKQVSAFHKGGGDVEFGDASGTSPARLFPQLEDKGGTIKLVGQLTGDHSNHPRVIVFATNHQQGQIGFDRKQLLLCLGENLIGQSLPLGVLLLDDTRQLACLT